MCAVFLAPVRTAPAQDSREYQLKAVLLLNLVRFVEWPSSAFKDTNAPVTIGVLGDDPFGPLLDQACRDEKINDRRIAITRCASVNEATNCHLLFVCASERQEFENINTRLANMPVLTVSDTEGFIRSGGIVRLYTQPDHEIKLRVNTEAAKSAGLTVSAKVLRLAEVAHRDDD